jgi:hypothetical protein
MDIAQFAIGQVERKAEWSRGSGIRWRWRGGGIRAEVDDDICAMDTQSVKRIPAFCDTNLRACHPEQFHVHIHPYGLDETVGMESRPVKTERVHTDAGDDYSCGSGVGNKRRMTGKGGSGEPERAHINQSVFSAMSEEEAVYLYPHRQILFPFKRAIEEPRRMVKRREVEMPQFNIPSGLFVGDGDTFIQDYIPDGRRI